MKAVFQKITPTILVSRILSMSPRSNPMTDAEAARPVVIITKEHMDAAHKRQATKPRNYSAILSPVSDESVRGYPTDLPPKRNGAGEIKEVVDIITAADIPCCLVAEPALIYYGAGRVMHVRRLCS